MGKAHIDRIHSVIAGGRVVAVSDVNPDNAAAVAEKIGGIAFADSASLISSADVDAVMILGDRCTPSLAKDNPSRISPDDRSSQDSARPFIDPVLVSGTDDARRPSALG